MTCCSIIEWSPCDGMDMDAARGAVLVNGRGLHSSTFQLNLSRVGHTPLCPPV
jgi:hypothetical protein